MIKVRTFLPLFFILSFLFHSGLRAQKSELPIDEVTGLVTYKAVNLMGKLSLKEMQTRAYLWAYEYYTNPIDVIRELDTIKPKDTVGGKMVLKARLKIKNEPDKKGVVTEAGLIEYTLTFEFKENRYRYTITDINWKQKSYFPIEKWMKTSEPGYQAAYPYYLEQTDLLMKQLIKDLEKGMNKPVPETKKDHW